MKQEYSPPVGEVVQYENLKEEFNALPFTKYFDGELQHLHKSNRNLD